METHLSAYRTGTGSDYVGYKLTNLATDSKSYWGDYFTPVSMPGGNVKVLALGIPL